MIRGGVRRNPEGLPVLQAQITLGWSVANELDSTPYLLFVRKHVATDGRIHRTHTYGNDWPNLPDRGSFEQHVGLVAEPVR